MFGDGNLKKSQQLGSEFNRPNTYMTVEAWVGINFLVPLTIIDRMIMVYGICGGDTESLVNTCNLRGISIRAHNVNGFVLTPSLCKNTV